MEEKSRASPKRVFIWDLDDTLIWTSGAYSRAFAKSHDYMSQLYDDQLIELRTLGTNSEKIDEALIKEINPRTGKPYGYSMYRFPESLVRTYKWLCGRGFGKYQEAIAIRVRNIGMEAFDPLGYKQRGLVSGAEETLNFINGQGDVQVLTTKGEQLVQECKIVTLDLDRWFENRIEIVDAKTKETFLGYQSQFPDCSVFSVGNSYNSDIIPALEAGVKAIYIPYFTWRGEEPPAEIDKSRVFEVKDIRQIIDLYKKDLI